MSKSKRINNAGVTMSLVKQDDVKLPAHEAGLPGKETMLTLHPLSPPTRRGLRDVLPVKLWVCEISHMF